MRKKIKIGDPRRSSLKRNCMICSKWLTCRDPSKAGDYACSRFRENEEQTEALMELFDQQNGKPPTAEDIDARIAQANDELSISSILEEIIESGMPVPPDLRLNDKEIPRPDNFFQWATDPRFVFEEQPPFAKQIQVGTYMMAEYCPDCTDVDWFEDVPVAASMDKIQERVTFLKRGKCPTCKVNKAEFIADEVLNDPTQMVGVAGQRASKSATYTLLESYNIARWLLVPNLPKTYNVLPSAALVWTYTATTFGQARQNLWEPLNSIFTGSAWYKQYHAFLTKKGYQLGEELFVHNETAIRYRHKNMFISPAAPSKRVMRGATRGGVGIDELGWFPVGKTKGNKDFERLDAKEVHTALLRSLRTLKSAYRRRMEEGYYDIPKPWMGNISSPSSVNDMIMTLYRREQGSKETYCFKYKTWEFNPLLKKKDFAEEFRTNPIEAARDYECEPPIGVNAWFTDKEVLEQVFNGPSNGVKTLSTRVTTKSGKRMMTGHIKLTKRPDSNYSGVLALDAGYNNNSFAWAVAYPVTLPTPPEEQLDEDEIITRTKVKLHSVGEIIPNAENPISFASLYKNVFLPLCAELNIGVIISDRWQNIKMVQDLEEAVGCAYFEHRLGKDDFDNYREAIFDKNVILPKIEMSMSDIENITMDDYPSCFRLKPVSHLIYQHLTVVSTGNTVIKGDTTDDLFRATVLAYTALQMPDILEEIVPVEDDDIRTALGAVSIGAQGARGSGMGLPGIAQRFSANSAGNGSGARGLGIRVSRR